MTATLKSFRLQAQPAPSRIAAFLSWFLQTDRRAIGFLIGFSLLALVPGVFRIPPVDRDEARVAQATKQMLESGNFADLRFQNEMRYLRPVGVAWAQAATVKLAQALGVEEARTRIWVYRLPSLFAGIAGVVLTFWAALAFVSRRGALMAAMMLAASVLLGVEARLAKTDALFFLACVAVMGAMARAYLGVRARDKEAPGWREALIFWSALAAGIMIKGPLIVMFVALATGALAAGDRSLRWIARLRPLAGVPLLAALLAPWMIVVALTSAQGFAPLTALHDFAHDVIGRIAGTEAAHRAWPGFYALLFWITFFPASVLVGFAVPFVWRARRLAGVRFLLAWTLPSWIVLELAMTKLPGYALPLYPAIAILIALAIEREVLSRRSVLVRHVVWWFIVPSLAIMFAIGVAMVIGRQLAFFAWPFAVAIIVLGFLTWRLYEQDGAERSLLRAGLTAILLNTAFYGVLVPSLDPFFPSVALARSMHEAPCANPLAASVGFHEPSLVFLTGTATVLTSPSEAADFLDRGACRFAFIDTRFERAFAQRADAIGLRYAPGARIEAFNLGAGRFTTIAVYTSDVGP